MRRVWRFPRLGIRGRKVLHKEAKQEGNEEAQMGTRHTVA